MKRQRGFSLIVVLAAIAIMCLLVIAAAMQFPNSFMEKYDWLAKHLPFIPWTHIVFCGDKSVIATDYLVDDHAKNFIGFRGEGILFTAHHNVNVTGYRRVANWREVRALFLSPDGRPTPP
jgi:5'(3')-deoxyribonucleotidase